MGFQGLVNLPFSSVFKNRFLLIINHEKEKIVGREAAFPCSSVGGPAEKVREPHTSDIAC
jgi:hypothetical protein